MKQVEKYQGPGANGKLAMSAQNQTFVFSVPLVGAILGAVTSGFLTTFDLPSAPSGVAKMIDNGISNPNVGKVVSVSSQTIPQTVYGVNGQVVTGVKLNVLSNDEANQPGLTGSSTNGSSPTSTGSGAANLGDIAAGRDGRLTGGSTRGCSITAGRDSGTGFSTCGRSGTLSAFGPVGGAVDRPDGMTGLGAEGTGGMVEGVGAAAVTEAVGIVGFGATVGFASSAGFLQTFENPKAGIAAGGDEARGAYLSLEASARLANRSFRSDSRRASLALKGSVAMDERRE